MCQHQEDFSNLRIEVLLVSFSAPEVARVWLEETCPSFRLLLDPERTAYHSYGMERSWLRSWNLRTLRRYIQLMRAGRRWRGIKGDSAQLGGDFIIDESGTIRFAYCSHDPTDRPSADYLLTRARQLGHEATGG